jgi:hypothetical protein
MVLRRAVLHEKAYSILISLRYSVRDYWSARCEIDSYIVRNAGGFGLIMRWFLGEIQAGNTSEWGIRIRWDSSTR